jgi:hypothetical protein
MAVFRDLLPINIQPRTEPPPIHDRPETARHGPLYRECRLRNHQRACQFGTTIASALLPFARKAHGFIVPNTQITGRAARMWQQYRKTFIPIQALILTVCVVMWLFRVDFRSIRTLFVVMQVCSLYGASMGARWSRRLFGRKETLPLSRR